MEHRQQHREAGLDHPAPAGGEGAVPFGPTGSSFEAFLLDSGVLGPADLARIMQDARRIGVPFLAHAVAEGHIGEETAYRALAAFHDLPFLTDPGAGAAVVESAALIEEAATVRWAELALPGGQRFVAAAPDDARHTTTRHLPPVRARSHLIDAIATPSALRRWTRPVAARRALEDAVLGLGARFPDFSARRRLTRPQQAVLAVLGGGLLAGAVMAAAPTAIVVFAVSAAVFAAVTLLRLVLLSAALEPARRGAPPAEPPDRDLPVYTVLVPLFREAHMVGDLVQALAGLDYPRAKLDIKLILEADDRATREAVDRLALPAPFDTILVPAAAPRTKPKALDFALNFARGEFVCVFDAEDIPDPGQLRQALAAFRAGGEKLVCVQARLDSYNLSDGWLARQFAVEYAALFHVILPACGRLGLPLLLGGTSNHLRIAALRAVGGWDPHNVTEDADLGIRLARCGLQCGLIDSVTLEEAPATLGNWFGQRMRWLRGWLQTYFVHMRAPLRLARELGPVRFAALQAMLGGVLISALAHPFFVAHLISTAVFGGWYASSDSVLGESLLAVSALNLLAGYCVIAEIAVLGLYRTGRSRLLPAIGLLPLYWLLISLAAYGAVWRFMVGPFRWEKTRHHSRRRRARPVRKAPARAARLARAA